ncbi:MAG: FecR domain-containing protein [Methylococcales bacterium]|nr:FecR domain-containing protein [Methylococcales bacterium]
MNLKHKKHKKHKCYLFLVFLLMSYDSYASPPCSKWIAKIISIQGKVDTQTMGKTVWQAVDQKNTFCAGDKIRISKHSRATIQMNNQTRITLDQSSTMVFESKKHKSSPWFVNILNGAAFFRSRQPQHLSIETPFINAVHEGTEFLVNVNSKQTEISVFDGQVAATNQQGEIHIKKGFTGIATKNAPPQIKALVISPEDAVQWTLYYPPIIDIQNNALVKLTINSQNNIDNSLALLEKNQDLQHNVNYLSYIASLLLSVGSVDDALSYIDKVQTLDANNSDAIALRAIIDVTKNRQNNALGLAQKAVSINSQSATAQIALSYAHQALFNIELALKTAQKAVLLSPENALAWARLSELQLSIGERSDALESAQKAQRLNPKLALTQTILGFAYLAQIEIDEANIAFTKAIKLNSAAPLARLGLGLAKIRKGNVEEGTHDLETAVSLDPDNAIMRSYLGKAYYELKNQNYAETELSIAKEMDPKDPTPWFYDGILKQTANRPIEALHDMQKAIELNNNRAVYRSKLLLDEDLAARSASLGRIYNDLGFQRLGLVEGWKSVNTHPSDFSGHRLLADNYASLPRHQIARVSELLQSQLLQPINVVPIQPQLAETQLGILEGTGSSSSSFNEFNPLFTRNKINFQANGVFGSNNTIGEDIVLSGLYDNFSFSLGQFHYESDGYRENNEQESDIYNTFFQLALSNRTNLQFEYRYLDKENGDISLKFDRDNFLKTEKTSLQSHLYRFGLHHVFSNQSEVIVSSLISEQEDESIGNPFINSKNESDGLLVEGQHILKFEQFKMLTGVGVFRDDRADTELKNNDSFRCFPQCNSTSDKKTNHYNGYIYSYLNVFPNLDFTIGLSVNSIEDEFGNKLRYNPKVGLSWGINDSVSFRAATFRTIKRSLVANQTIEPTQVSGFNQLYDDGDSTSAWNYGVAFDFKLTKELSSGVEFFLRDLDVLFLAEKEGESFTESTDWHETYFKSYLDWTPHPLWAFGVQYQYERLDESKAFSTGALDLQTHIVPISIGFFHPSGISGNIVASYYKQLNIALDSAINTETPEHLENKLENNSEFWVVNAGVGLRLPNRFGKLSLKVLNLFNTPVKFQDIDKTKPRVAPERMIFGAITINL